MAQAADMSGDAPLWRPAPERIESTNLARFADHVKAQWGVDNGRDYDALWRWSVDEAEKFWLSLWDFCGVIAETRGETVVSDPDKLPGARFFPDARLNFAENLLRRRDDTVALKFWGEDQVRREMTWAELYDASSRLAQALAADGIGPGDRVAAYMPNMPETIVAMLAATSLGAVFSSCSAEISTLGSICPKRSSTPCVPKSGEQDEKTAPRLVAASMATMVSGMLGM